MTEYGSYSNDIWLNTTVNSITIDANEETKQNHAKWNQDDREEEESCVAKKKTAYDCTWDFYSIFKE